mgnify:CR=1 FL=1
MLALGYGDWAFWETYNPPLFLGQQKVTFDGPNRRILINFGETEIDFRTDVYSAWKEWQMDPNHINSKYALAISAIGGDPLPGNRAHGTTYFLENNWKIRTWEGEHVLTITGNVFDRNGASIISPTLLPWNITINLNTSTLVETVIPESSLTQADLDLIAEYVWAEELSVGTTARDYILNIPANVWDEIIDNAKSQSARAKLRAIATKTQDIALN